MRRWRARPATRRGLARHDLPAHGTIGLLRSTPVSTPTIMTAALLFAWQMYSIVSSSAVQRMKNPVVQGRVYAPGSSISHLDLHVVGVETSKSLNQVELVRVRRALPLHPESFVEADRVDDQRVPFPVADRVSVVTGSQIFGMRPTVHVDDMERLRAGLVDDVDSREVRHIHELDAARRDELPAALRRACSECEARTNWFRDSLIERSGPRLKRNFALLRLARETAVRRRRRGPGRP